MNDRELETMFRSAASEPPEPTFDTSDVVSASRRATARRRSTITMACTCAVVVVAGLGVTGVVLNQGETASDTSAVAGQTSDQTKKGTALAIPGQPGQESERPPDEATPQDFPASPKQGGEDTGENGPRAGTSGCDKVDRELATALAGELPDTVLPDTARAAPTAGRVCPTGSRSAGFPIRAGDRSGDLSVAIVPPGSVTTTGIAGEVTDQRLTASDQVVVVVSVPVQGSTGAPLPEDVARIAAAIAARY